MLPKMVRAFDQLGLALKIIGADPAVEPGRERTGIDRGVALRFHQETASPTDAADRAGKARLRVGVWRGPRAR